MRGFIDKYALMNRVAVSDETNMVAEYVSKRLGGNIIEAHSGQECLTWIIPKKWAVKEAYIESMNGKKLVDFKDHPLHLFSYSEAFNGIVKKEDLEEHLFYDERYPDNIPYHYKYQYAYGSKGWGFSLAYNVYKTMKDEKYKVVIDAKHDNGVMKVADCYIKGKIPETIVFAVHNCHPGQVNDGLSSVAVGIKLFEYLKSIKTKYSYRLVIGPEFYAGAAFLALASEVDKIKYGIYLDMLISGDPIGVSYSYSGNTRIDRIVKNVVKKYDPGFKGVPYRELSGNDEFLYEGPDFNIPMVCIGRDDYPEYHLDSDDIEHVDFSKLEQMVKILKDIVNRLETELVPVRKYRGSLYLSRYGISRSTQSDKNKYTELKKADIFNIDKMQILMDGENSCYDIADKLGLTYDEVRSFVDQLINKGLAVPK